MHSTYGRSEAIRPLLPQSRLSCRSILANDRRSPILIGIRTASHQTEHDTDFSRPFGFVSQKFEPRFPTSTEGSIWSDSTEEKEKWRQKSGNRESFKITLHGKTTFPPKSWELIKWVRAHKLHLTGWWRARNSNKVQARVNLNSPQNRSIRSKKKVGSII